MLVSAMVFENIGNFYVSETKYDRELHTKFEDCTPFCSNIKTEKKDFLTPPFNRKTVSLAQKNPQRELFYAPF